MRTILAVLCLSLVLALATTIGGFHEEEARADTPPYGVSFYLPTGNPTCSGEPYYGSGHTAAASPMYPIGTILEVRWHGYATVVRVNDCTPYPYGPWATFDLSWDTLEDLPGAYYAGRIYPEVTVLAYGDGVDPWSGWCYLYGC